MAWFLSLPCSFFGSACFTQDWEEEVRGGSEIEFGVWVKPIRGKGDVTGTERKMAGPSARPQQEKGRRSLTKELKDRATFSKASK